MSPMTPDEARAIERPTPKPGDRLRFFSTLQETDSAGIRVRDYSGQEVEVVRDNTLYGSPDFEDIGERIFTVRADDGVEFGAWEGEIDGFYFDTGQFYGPREG